MELPHFKKFTLMDDESKQSIASDSGMSNWTSKCCNDRLRSIVSDEGTGYYVCSRCNKPCDISVGKVEENKLTSELDLCDGDIQELYKNTTGYFKGAPLLAQLIRELKKLNEKL